MSCSHCHPDFKYNPNSKTSSHNRPKIFRHKYCFMNCPKCCMRINKINEKMAFDILLQPDYFQNKQHLQNEKFNNQINQAFQENNLKCQEDPKISMKVSENLKTNTEKVNINITKEVPKTNTGKVNINITQEVNEEIYHENTLFGREIVGEQNGNCLFDSIFGKWKT